MVHPIFIGEGQPDELDKFERLFQDKYYANGKARVRMRTLRIYMPSINEVGYNEFLSDLKSFSGYVSKDIEVFKDTSYGLKRTFQKYIKIITKFFPQMKSLSKDLESVNDSGLRGELTKKGEHYIMCIHPVGRVNDGRNPNGTEIV